MSDAHEAIRRLIAIYAQLLDSKRIAEWGDLFVSDAEFRVEGRALLGRDVIADTIGAMQPETPVKHVILSPVIDLLDDDRARSWTDMCAAVGTETGVSTVTIGRYYDDLVRDRADGQWRFARRVLVMAHETVPDDVEPSPAR